MSKDIENIKSRLIDNIIKKTYLNDLEKKFNITKDKIFKYLNEYLEELLHCGVCGHTPI